MYDVAVIGAGAAGLTIALGAAELGKKTVLFEKRKIGGDCTHYGCMPSKTLIHTAQKAFDMRNASRWGLTDTDTDISWEKIRAHVQGTIDSIYAHETPEVLRKHGVHVVQEHARFIGKNILQAEDKTYRAKKIYICTGSKPRTIDIPGSKNIDIHTNETIFSLKKQPKTLAVLGAGPIGCELGQAFSRLGTTVHLISTDDVLVREDEDARAQLKKQFKEENITIHTDTTIKKITKKNVLLTDGSQIPADALLLAIGRVANTQDLGLENTDVTVLSDRRIKTDTRLRAARGIYALGDCTSKYQFSHVCEEHGRIVIANIASPIPIKSFDETIIPWVTFTDPQIAHVGKYEQEISGRYETFTVDFSENDRATTEHDTRGFVKIHCRPISGKILGATIVGEAADSLLAVVTLAIKQKISIRALSDTIQAYPTRAQLVRHTADYWYREYFSRQLEKFGF